MGKFIDNYLNIITNMLCGILLILGGYNIIVNVLHAGEVGKTLYLSGNDASYQEYTANLKKIESNINNYEYKNSEYDAITMSTLKTKISYCYSLLNSTEAIGGLTLNTYINQYDIYRINNNFMNTIVNECWISGMSSFTFGNNHQGKYFHDVLPKYSQTIVLLVNDSDYLRNELLNNSSFAYTTNNSSIFVRNTISEQYAMLMRNYEQFSEIIYKVSEYLVDGEY